MWLGRCENLQLRDVVNIPMIYRLSTSRLRWFIGFRHHPILSTTYVNGLKKPGIFHVEIGWDSTGIHVDGWINTKLTQQI